MGSSWWRHQMETVSALLALCAGNSPVNYPHKGQWRDALMFSVICAWTNGWVNNRDAVDLRRRRTNYDVTVMWWMSSNRRPVKCLVSVVHYPSFALRVFFLFTIFFESVSRWYHKKQFVKSQSCPTGHKRAVPGPFRLRSVSNLN